MNEGSRYLGVDLGTKRIGFAISGPGKLVSALTMLPARRTAAENARVVLEVVEEYGADAVVLGLPLNMDGGEGPQAGLSRLVERALREQAPQLPIYLHDERLTSHAADQELAGRDLTRDQKRSRQDAIAARILLESFLSRVTGETSPVTPQG